MKWGFTSIGARDQERMHDDLPLSTARSTGKGRSKTCENGFDRLKDNQNKTDILPNWKEKLGSACIDTVVLIEFVGWQR